MLALSRRAALAAAILMVPAVASAQARLPVEEGVYAEAGASCASGWLWVYSGQRAGYLSFYGPNQSMGPDLSQVEQIQSVGPGHDGFTALNDSGAEVRPAGEGQIIVAAYSRVEGHVGSTRFRRCAVSSLHPRMRAAVAQLGYSEGAAGRGNPSAPANSAPGVGFWQGTYICSQGVTGVRLAIRTLGRNSPQREATFTFYDVDGRAEEPQGSFVLRGTIRGERLVLEPHEWRQRYRNYAMVGLDGEIRGETYTGRVTGLPGCTTFSVQSMTRRF